MKARVGKFANFGLVTVCSASFLNAFSIYPASCDPLHDVGASGGRTASSESVKDLPAANDQTAPMSGAADSASANSATQTDTASQSGASTSGGTTSGATTNAATTNAATTNAATTSAATTSGGTTSAATTSGGTTSATNSDSGSVFLRLIEAVTGKPSPPEIADLLKDVVSLKRVGNAVELTRADSSKVTVAENSRFGATVIGGFSEAREKVAGKFGDEVGRLIDEFVGVTSNGNHLEVIREGPELEDIDLSERKVKKQLPLRRVRLTKVSMDVEIANGHPILKNITGIEAVPNSGLEIPLVLKEFSRSTNQAGEDVFNFGIKNPFPLMKPFKRLLGIKEIIPFTWTAKKQDSKEIGARDPAEHKE